MLYAPKNEDVCENIKQENSEFRVENLRRSRRSVIEDVRALEMLQPSESEVARSPPADSAL